MNTSDEPLPAPAAVPGRARTFLSRSPVLAGLAAFLLLAGLVLVTSTLLGRGSRPLYPNLPTFTPLSETLESKPTVLTFTELNADPDAYRDRRIQVAGNYASVSPPTCAPFSGPAIRWTLVADELQLNAVGFENILRLLAEGTPMTVTGTWRLYRGPSGWQGAARRHRVVSGRRSNPGAEPAAGRRCRRADRRSRLAAAHAAAA